MSCRLGPSISRRATVTVACAVVLTSALPAHMAAAGQEPDSDDTSQPTAPSTTVAENVFLPERDLDECISSLPKPDCGSKQRGGWRQTLVFGVMLGGMAAIGARIAYSVRRSERQRGEITGASGPAPAPRR